jgi:heme-degrading monooxygenase HmoA
VSQRFHLAQLNIGKLLAPIDSLLIKDFKDNLGRINALAETQPGFVWRLVGEGDDATDIRPFDDPDMAVNLSVWESLDSLAAFVYRTAHRDIMRRRREWFDAMQTYMVLWWVPAGETPTVEEAKARLERLARLGPTPDAFTFREPFPAPGVARPETSVLDRCA